MLTNPQTIISIPKVKTMAFFWCYAQARVQVAKRQHWAQDISASGVL